MIKPTLLLASTICILLSLQGHGSTSSKKFFISETNKTYKYVYLRANKVNLRSGPNTRHPIKWTVRNKGEPMKVLGNFYQWLNVEDIHGNKGWLQTPMISVRYMYGIVVDKKPVIGYAMDSPASRKIVKLEPGVRLRVLKCKNTGWCKIRADNFKAWILQKNLWGINLQTR